MQNLIVVAFFTKESRMWAIWLDAIFAKKSAQFLQRHESVVQFTMWQSVKSCPVSANYFLFQIKFLDGRDTK